MKKLILFSAEIFRKTGGKGPGGCQGREECETFCNDPANQQSCFDFARSQGLISEEELQKFEQFAPKPEDFAPPESFPRGEFMPPEGLQPPPGLPPEQLQQYEEQFRQQYEKQFQQQYQEQYQRFQEQYQENYLPPGYFPPQ